MSNVKKFNPNQTQLPISIEPTLLAKLADSYAASYGPNGFLIDFFHQSLMPQCLPLVARIYFPPRVMKTLHKHIGDQIQEFERDHGEIKEDLILRPDNKLVTP
jgi:hypothetical protein